ncbi:imidazole glycerol phosphate synthase subunit HisH [Planktothrix agardhii]|jgi:glutamine amidotransferase|uniref:Imidazole glycerol phosphate synthase subunit HisH n=2 Tax=Planktothrix agardhii TaxID=1160 RepID=A0A073CH31_PLAA1|nr:imidazole glycerol phosphate synthase subunit HisH [Planktothrix agardhii]MCF3606935.1 imidazole glycerol phosphate synthase subunit HisH [Planktothrix agardhii 1033]BBD52779.1 imidazole glycerol phosphate synthase, glutamine amidotransferase subunit [Planktothrix agardhii NIES-204]KEI67222.1 HisH [Planktothrix agardhii NIVA-CYA 126/8]MBG0747413.1 imidazole glycerol phosphate synthase subunit HisH [Planktothrix agardhii KL2]MCB8751092.1 imidazole glycerol phosphate synthase subunit HisH [Pl
MSVIAVIDYDMGNLHSVCKGLEKAGVTPQVTDSATIIKNADAVVLPGVGSFDPAMQHLRSRNLVEPIQDVIASGVPFLGICLGLQILFESSEEGQEKGLGIFPGTVRRFQSEPGLTIPHIGWNQLSLIQPDLPLWKTIGSQPWVYFVHSYYVDPTDRNLTAATIQHGSQIITAAIAKDNVMAVQFHPEKSSNAGLKILDNFVELVQGEPQTIEMRNQVSV